MRLESVINGDAGVLTNAKEHGHFKVDIETVQDTIHHDLPGPYQQVPQTLDQLPTCACIASHV